GALPAQALDHGTGYLLAAGVLRALTERQSDGRGRLLRFSLAWTAHWLMHGISSEPVGRRVYEPTDWLTETDSPYGRLRHALPPLHYEASPGNWETPPTRWGNRSRHLVVTARGVVGSTPHSPDRPLKRSRRCGRRPTSRVRVAAIGQRITLGEGAVPLFPYPEHV